MSRFKLLLITGTIASLFATLSACKLTDASTDEPDNKTTPGVSETFLTSKTQSTQVSDIKSVEFDVPLIVFDEPGNAMMVWTSTENRMSNKHKLHYSFYNKMENIWSVDQYFETKFKTRNMSLTATDNGFVLLQYDRKLNINLFSIESGQWQYQDAIKRHSSVVTFDISNAEKGTNTPFNHAKITQPCAECHSRTGEITGSLPPGPPISSGAGGAGGINSGIIFGDRNRLSPQLKTPGSTAKLIVKTLDGFNILFEQFVTTYTETETIEEKVLAINSYRLNSAGSLELNETLEIDRTQSNSSRVGYSSPIKANLLINEQSLAVIWQQNNDDISRIQLRLITLNNLEMSATETLYETEKQNRLTFNAKINTDGIAVAVFHNLQSDLQLTVFMCYLSDNACHWSTEVSLDHEYLATRFSQSINLFSLDNGFVLAIDSSTLSWYHIYYNDDTWQTSIFEHGDETDNMQYETLFAANNVLYVDFYCQKLSFNSNGELTFGCRNNKKLKFRIDASGAYNDESVQIPDEIFPSDKTIDRNYYYYDQFSIAINGQGNEIIAGNILTESHVSSMYVTLSDSPPSTTEIGSELNSELNNSSSAEPEIIKLSDENFLIIWRQSVNGTKQKHVRPFVDGKWY